MARTPGECAGKQKARVEGRMLYQGIIRPKDNFLPRPLPVVSAAMFRLPRTARPTVARKRSPAVPGLGVMAEIAVVEDDPSMCAALERLLRASGFQVATFPSAEAFLGRSSQERIRCLILDIHLGGMTGFALQERLAASGCRVPIVFITAHDDIPTRERAGRAGAAGYLRKPFDRTELLQAICKALGPRGVERGGHPRS